MALSRDRRPAVHHILRMLERQRKVWRRTEADSPGGRRNIKRRVGAVRRGIRIAFGPDTLKSWSTAVVPGAEPGEQYILFPGPETLKPGTLSSVAVAPRRTQRKFLKALLNDALGQRWDGDLLASSTPDRPRRVAGFGGAFAAGDGLSVRARGLEAIGVAILENLSQADLRSVREAGYTVLRNRRVTLPDPLAGPVAPADTASVDVEADRDAEAVAVAMNTIAPPLRDTAETTADGDTTVWRGWHRRVIGLEDQTGARQVAATGKGTVIGVLDTGICSHREFKGKKVSYRSFRQDGSQHLKQRVRDFDTTNSHGTHVASISAGSSCGIAPDADLRVAAVLTSRTRDGMSGMTAQVLGGLNWLIKEAAEDGRPTVINASLGSSGYDPYLRSLIADAEKLNILFVAAIGNSGDAIDKPTHGSPGNYSNVLAVGATDGVGSVCAFSGWGKISEEGDIDKPDVCAPGWMIWSAVADRTSTERYAYRTGTSMAAPIVSGAACVLMEADPPLARDPRELRARLLGSAEPIETDTGRSGAGHFRF